MNDDLVKRLREPCFERGLDEMWIDDQRNEAADRIAELEAALDSEHASVGHNIWRFWSDKAREIAGKNTELRQKIKTTRNDALREAASLDWRDEWLINFNRMRKAGESKEMAGRWFCKQASDVILAMIDKDTNPE